MLLARGLKPGLDIRRTSHLQVLKPQPQRRRGELRLFFRLRVARGDRGPKHGYTRKLGNDLLQKLQLFAADLGIESRQSGNVSAGSSQAGDKPVGDGIAIEPHDDWNCARRFPGRGSSRRAAAHDEVYLEVNQLGCEARQPIGFAFRGTVLDDNVLSLHVPKVAEALPECADAGGVGCQGSSAQEAYPRDFRLLRRGYRASTEHQESHKKPENFSHNAPPGRQPRSALLDCGGRYPSENKNKLIC